MNITELITDLDKQLQEGYKAYQDLQKELEDKYANRKIEEKELDAVKELVGKIQDAFSAIWPALNFTMRRNADATAITANYTQFVENLKRNK